MREKLAELAHSQWSGWMEYLFSKCIDYKPDTVQAEEGAAIIPKWAVDRWKRQAITPYSSLTPAEMDSDRTEADKFLAVFDADSAAANDRYKDALNTSNAIHLRAIEAEKINKGYQIKLSDMTEKLAEANGMVEILKGACDGYIDVVRIDKDRIAMIERALEKIIIEVGTSTLANTIATTALTPPDTPASGQTPESGVTGGIEFNES